MINDLLNAMKQGCRNGEFFAFPLPSLDSALPWLMACQNDQVLPLQCRTEIS